MQTGCERNCSACLGKLCTRKIPIFSSLTYHELEGISKRISHREYRKGETILIEGESPEFVAIISGGSAKAYSVTPEGREQILYIFSEGDFFGEQNLFRRQSSAYTVETLEASEACFLYRGDFEAILGEYPNIALKVIEELGGRMARLESAIQSMGVRSVDARISGTLVEFASKYGTETPEGILIHLPISREGIANYIGIARETVSRKLSQLENDGVIRQSGNKSLLISDLSELKLASLPGR